MEPQSSLSSTLPADGSLIPPPFSAFEVIWNEPIDTVSFTTADVLVSRDTSIAVTSVTGSGVNFVVAFPAQAIAGSYQLVVGPEIFDLAGNMMNQDADGTPGEPVDDRAEVNVQIIAVPDLRIEAAVAANQARFGETIRVTYRVINTGGASTTGQLVDRFWLTADGSLQDAMLIGSYAHGTRVIMWRRSHGICQAQIPLQESYNDGLYYLVIETDSLHDQLESDESNNLYAAPIELRQPPVPDLVVSAISGPTDVQPGQHVELTWQLENQGTAATGAAWVDAVLLVAAGQPDQVVVAALCARCGVGEVSRCRKAAWWKC